MLGIVGGPAHERKQFACRAMGGFRRGGGVSRGKVGGDVEVPVVTAQLDHIAIAHARQRAAAERLGAAMDRRGDSPAGARHAAVGNQSDLVPAILEHA